MGKDGDPGGQTMSPKDPKMQAAKVRLLDGTHKDFELHRGSDGEALFVLVSADLSIEEREYFSLCFYDTEGTRHWLYNDKKILRQLKGLPWEFCFEVKFYPTVPSSLIDDHARYNLFLQLRNDVCSGRLPATIDTHAALGALVAQAQFGDAKPTPEYEEYLRSTKFAPENSEQLLQMIAQKHKEHKGLTAAEAENLFMDMCKQQTMYGIFVYNAKDSKNAPVGIGICAYGIYIYKEQIRVNRFPWQGIIKISYRKNQFAIKLKAGEIDKKEATVVYKVADYQHAKRIWKCAVEHHTFFRLIQPDEKPKSSLFRWGSARFRYQGRTQFQTKMASQMFDKPNTVAVQRASSARLTHSLDNVAKEQVGSGHVSPLHYADNELGSHEPMASPAVTYEVSGQSEKRKLDDKVGNGLPSDDDDGDELVYTPVESPTSAAYYISERSSACSPSSIEFNRSQISRTPLYSWKMSESGGGTASASHAAAAASASGGDAGARYLYHNEPSSSYSLPNRSSPLANSSIDSTEKRPDIEQIPIDGAVQVYHEGHYYRLENQPRTHHLQQRYYNAQLNGVPSVRRLGPDQEMDPHPIRYFVNVHHSGSSHIPRVSRDRHPGREEVGAANPSNYIFRMDPATPVQRLEPHGELPPHNIRQYSSVYHHGSSLVPNPKPTDENAPPVPPPRLIARVLPSPSVKAQAQTAADGSSVAVLDGKKPKELSDSKDSSRIRTQLKTRQLENGEGEVAAQKHTSTESTSYNISSRTATSHDITPQKPGRTQKQTNLFGRKRHEGEEDTIEKERVRPETYGVASVASTAPLDTTTRNSELASVPLQQHAQAYHHGQSWDDGKAVKVSTGAPSDVDRSARTTGVLHLKTTPVKGSKSPTMEEETKKLRLIARVPVKSTEDEAGTTKPKKGQDSPGRLAFWKSGGRKHRGDSHEGANGYPTTDKYQGPLEDVNRQKDIDLIPITSPKSVPYKPAPADAVNRPNGQQTHLFGRWRHDGDEETVEKSHVRPESYGVASTSYDGPLDSTTRSSDLPSVPLREHAKAYHAGQSWHVSKDVKVSAGASIKPERSTGDTAVLHMTPPVKERSSPPDDETKKVRLIARVPPKASQDDAGAATPKSDKDTTAELGFWKVGSRKRRGRSHEATAEYAVSEKDQSQLEIHVNRQKDVNIIPLTSPKSPPYKSASADAPPQPDGQRTQLFGRWRHDGEEDTVEKGHVRPETYGIKTTSYEGPLENTSLNSDLPSAPLREHAQMYHHGLSWDHGRSAKFSESTPIESDSRVGKTDALHLKSTHAKDKPSPSSEEDTKKVRLIARVPAKAPEDAGTAKPKRDHDSSRGLTFWKFGNRKRHGSPHEASADYPTTDKYQGPLESVNPQRDIDMIPLTSPKSVPYKPASADSPLHFFEQSKSHLFGRLRHDGDEDTVEKHQVRPETYGIKTTSYESPLESTTRHSDLPSVPLREHAQVYHHGQSWDDGRGMKVSAGTSIETDRDTGKTAILHLKSTHTKDRPSPSSEEDTRKVRLIARIPPKTSEDEISASKLKKDHDSSSGLTFWKFGNRKRHGDSHEAGADYPTTDKYQGPLESMNPQRDIDLIPFTSPKSLPHKPASADAPLHFFEQRKSHLFGRLRHDGDEDTIEKDQVRPETYGIKTTSYESPLESTTRHSDLPSVPLREHAQVYHHGQSWDDGRGMKVSAGTSIETDRDTGKTAILHLKSTHTKDRPSPSSEEDTRKVRLIARIPPKTSEDEISASKLKKDHDSSSGLTFWKFGNRKRHGDSHEAGADYPTTDKYQGPLESMNPQRDIDLIPFTSPKSLPHKPASADAPLHFFEQRKSHLFGRLRHDGDEDTIEKDQVRPETYGIKTTSYESPLESTTRHSDLPSVPLREHAQVYHHGQSWDDGRGMKVSAGTSIETDRDTGKTAILHLKSTHTKDRPSPSSEEDTRKVRLIARIPPKTSEDEISASKLKKDHDSSSGLTFWKFGNRKRHGDSHEAGADYPTTDKYQGPLESMNPQRDIDLIPFTSPKSLPHKPASADAPLHFFEQRKSHLFGRLRHDGDEDTIEKDQVRPGTYGMKTASYEGPLESTTRHSDLPSVPLREHAQVYHHGQSWDDGRGMKVSAGTSVESDQNTGKTAILHLKSTHTKDKPSPSSEEDTRKVRLIARIPPKTSEDEIGASKLKKDHDSSRGLAFWKFRNRKRHGDSHEAGADYPTTDKYQGPLESMNPQRDIDLIPFTSPKSLPHKPASADAPLHFFEQSRSHLFGRWRHDGDEDTVEKDQVRPETYGVKTTSYEGPLESTTRHSDLPSVPLREHAQVYHHGQSWDDGRGMKVSAGTSIEADRNTGKTAVLHLKSTHTKDKPSPSSEEETRKMRLIARIPPKESEDEVDRERPRKDHDSSGGLTFWKFGNRKRHGASHGAGAESPVTDKYQGPLESVDLQKDIDMIPLTSPKSVPYKPASTGAPQHSVGPRSYLFGRWRHDGDEDIIEKDQVRPETYNIKTTTYEGPLDSTTRSSDLPSVPLREHTQAYHHGQSWDDGKAVEASASTPVESDRNTGKTAVLHLKSTHTKERPSPSSEEETRKVRLIARIPPKESEDEVDREKTKNDRDSSGGLTFWKFGNRKLHGDLREGTSGYPSSEKYQGPLEDVNRQKDIDLIPFTSSKSVPYKPASIGAPQQTGGQRSHLFGRWRHEGDEDTVEKDQVRPETYGITTTTYEGPVDSTTRSSDLPSVPLREHAQAYHHGQSWDDGKGLKMSASTPIESDPNIGKTAVLHLKPTHTKDKPSPSSEDETRKVRLIARIPPKAAEDEVDTEKSTKDRDSPGGLTFWKFGSRKRHGDSYEDGAGYPTTEKYQGPLESVNPQKDIDMIPLTVPTAISHKAAFGDASQHPDGKRTHLFGRWRHDGDEDIVEKDQVRPEKYGIRTTTYEGPLDSTTRSSDLPSVPLREHAQAYHPGQSWDDGMAEKVSATAPRETTAKAAVLHLKSTHTKDKPLPSSEEEAREVRLIARVPAKTPEDEVDTKKDDSSGGLTFWKFGNRKHRGDSYEEGAGYLTTERYQGPLESVTPQVDIDMIPITSPKPVPYKPASIGAPQQTGGQRSHLFGRWRHDGDEETVEKDQVRPETYGIKTTSYEGPLESTTRHSDLPSVPLREHAQVYHHGQSWDDGKAEKVSATAPRETTATTAVPHLKPTHTKGKPSPSTEEETREVRLIARVPAKTPEDEVDSTKPKKDDISGGLTFWKFGNRKHRGDSHEAGAGHSTTEKYQGPLESVTPQEDIDMIPITSPKPVPHKPASIGAPQQTGGQRSHLFGRWRHEGDEDTVEKDQVRPETYGIKTTTYEGPFDSTIRSSELPSVPLREHAQAYHHGQSWDDGKAEEVPATAPIETTAKTAVLHLKSTHTKDKPSPSSEDETRKVRLIARVPAKTPEDEVDSKKPKKDDISGGLTFWKFGNRKHRGDSHEDGAGYPSSEKYQGPLESVNPQRDIDMIPLTSPKSVPYKPASADTRQHYDGQRTHLFGRWRHDGDEDTVEKDQVRPETYGIKTTTYEGPLDSTTRSSDLPSMPLREHAKAYHHGQSWNDDRAMKVSSAAPTEIDRSTGKTAVLHLKSTHTKDKPLPSSDEETRKVRLIARVPAENPDDETDTVKAQPDHDSSGKFAFWKLGKRGGSDETTASYPTTEKYLGPLEDVNRQKDIDLIPFISPTPAPYKAAPVGANESTGRHRTNLFGRLRHGASEGMNEKDQGRPATHGQSWDHGKLVKEPAGTFIEATGKTDILHLEPTQLEEKSLRNADDETKKVRLVAHVLRKTSDDESATKDQDSSGRLASLKSPGKPELFREGTAGHPSALKYQSPLEDVSRDKDIDQIPFTAPSPAPYKPASTGAYEVSGGEGTHLFGRWRHGGDEETVAKDQVRPETYGIKTTSYEGPLDSTTRSSDLPAVPLRDHAQAYHVGESWKDGKDVKDSTGIPPGTDQGTMTTAVLHLKSTLVEKSSAKPSDETKKEELVTHVLRKTPYDDPHTVLDGKDMDPSGQLVWKSGDKEEPRDPLECRTVHPNAYKHKSPLEDVSREKEIDLIPFTSPTPVPYKPAATSATEQSSEKRTTLFGRWRRSGDEAVEKAQVRPGVHGVASTSFDGPLDSSTRSSELPSVPLQEHAEVYHPGQSWDDGRDVKALGGAKVEGHPRGAPQLKRKSTPASEEETEKVRLVARIARRSSEDNADAAKPKKDQGSSGKFAFWKSGNRKDGGDSVDGITARLISDKYDTALEGLDRQIDLDETVPLKTTSGATIGHAQQRPEGDRKKSDHDTDAAKPKKDQGSSGKFAFWKSGNRKDGGDSVDGTTASPSSDKHDTALEGLDRQKDLDETVPFKTTSGATIEHAEQRLEGDGKKSSEDGADALKPKKDQGFTGKFAFWKSGNRKDGKDGGDSIDGTTTARPSSDKHETALEGLDRQKELDRMVPYNTDASATTEDVQQRLEGDGKKSSEDDADALKPKKDQQSLTGKLAFWKSGNRKDGGDFARPSSDKHDTPLEGLDRQKDFDQVIPYRDARDSGVEHARQQPEGDGKRSSEDDADQAKSRKDQGFAGKFAFWKSGNRKDGGDSVDGAAVRPSSDKYDTTLEGVDRQKLLDQAPSYKIASGSAVEYIQRRDEGDEKDRVVSGAHGVASTSSGERRPESSTPHSDLPRGKPPRMYLSEESPGRLGSSHTEKDQLPSTGFWTRTRTTTADTSRPHVGGASYTIERTSFVTGDSENLVAASSSHAGRTEGTTMHGDEYVEVRVDRRVEVQLEPMYCMSGAGLGALAENADGMVFSVTPPMLSSSSTDRSFFSRFGFKSSAKKSKKQKKGSKEADSSDSSSSSEDEKNQIHVMAVESGGVTLPLYVDPQDKDGRVVRRETNELKYHLKGEGISPGFDPQNPESGQPHTTVSTWQESNRLPDEVTTEYDEKGNKITRTLKTSQVKHTVQKQTFQNYVVPTEGQPGAVTVEHTREETTPIGGPVVSTNCSVGSPHVVETHSRSVAYDAGTQNERPEEGLGEFVSCKTLTSGNRTVETYTYKTERDGIIETHVEHRVTIHSEEPIDHDAELSQAIMEATQMNPDMTVEKIEVRQESTA